MPISGLLLTLYDDASATDVIESLHQIEGVECGEPNGQWLPIAVDSPSARSSRDLHDQLLSIPGVTFVDVVSVSFDEALTPADEQHTSSTPEAK